MTNTWPLNLAVFAGFSDLSAQETAWSNIRIISDRFRILTAHSRSRLRKSYPTPGSTTWFSGTLLIAPGLLYSSGKRRAQGELAFTAFHGIEEPLMRSDLEARQSYDQ